MPGLDPADDRPAADRTGLGHPHGERPQREEAQGDRAPGADVEGRTPERTAVAMESDLRRLQEALGGRVWIAMWFSWSYPQYEMTDLRRDGQWSPVGKAWLAVAVVSE